MCSVNLKTMTTKAKRDVVLSLAKSDLDLIISKFLFSKSKASVYSKKFLIVCFSCFNHLLIMITRWNEKLSFVLNLKSKTHHSKRHAGIEFYLLCDPFDRFWAQLFRNWLDRAWKNATESTQIKGFTTSVPNWLNLIIFNK